MPNARNASSARVRALGLAQVGLVGLELLVEVVADPHQRVEPGHRLLEDQPHPGAAQPLPLLGRAGRGCPVRRSASAPSTAAPRGSRPIRPRPSVDLPQPDSPTRPSTSPGRQREADAVDGLHRAASARRTRPAGRRRRAPCPSERWRGRSDVDAHLLAFRRAGSTTWCSLVVRSSGLSTSLRLSPTSVTPTTSSTMARPGKTPVHQMPAAVSESALLQVVAPLGRRRRLDAEAEEAEAGQGQDRVAGVERGDDRHGLHDVAEDVAPHDRARAARRARARPRRRAPRARRRWRCGRPGSTAARRRP